MEIVISINVKNSLQFSVAIDIHSEKNYTINVILSEIQGCNFEGAHGGV